MKLKFEDRFGDYEIYGSQAYIKKEAENDASLCVIRHLQRNYGIVIRDVNKKKLIELKYVIENLKEANDKL